MPSTRSGRQLVNHDRSYPSSALVLFSGGRIPPTCLGLGAVALPARRVGSASAMARGTSSKWTCASRWPAHRGLSDLGAQARPRLRRVARCPGLGQQERAHGRPADGHAPRRPARDLRAGPQPGVPDLRRLVAHQRGLKHSWREFCETDFSGYPDCRDDTVKALQVAINLGMEARLVLETPLMWIDKAETWRLADAGRARVGRSDRRGNPHLLSRRPDASPRLGCRAAAPAMPAACAPTAGRAIAPRPADARHRRRHELRARAQRRAPAGRGRGRAARSGKFRSAPRRSRRREC